VLRVRPVIAEVEVQVYVQALCVETLCKIQRVGQVVLAGGRIDPESGAVTISILNSTHRISSVSEPRTGNPKRREVLRATARNPTQEVKHIENRPRLGRNEEMREYPAHTAV
jgi:hypothetical protein